MNNEEYYDFEKTPDIHYYEFSSIGPKGSIRKVIQFQQINLEENIYNLGFGDFCPETQEISDLITTNNLDTKKVLSTVARAVIDFMTLHPNAIVMAKGSTQARTRLYQMGISEFWDEIKEMFEVKGFYKDSWESFRKGKNYDAFFIFKK
ncbi:hypothetical protein FXV77_12000 [Sphingobacterium phlebotomi]|jgi:hypothetical protein|uniref:Uncharacterized protein n=1 Tax=Sphingobacterium phlebotomi TaxID=2605433 RepID=A0A5D4H5L0_9SPHI|nr:hypothetical protein [Sphingobacterium phlebotomi]TYR35794.1 hypothetical protein FXV77_12000 [Sphingobacterium phlebotomi]